MQTLPQTASTPQADSRARRTRPVEDVVYQLVTVGAILLVLGSIWLF